MTRIDTLAELLTQPGTDLVLVGEVGRDFTRAERELLLAALRLAEAVSVGTRTHDVDLLGFAREATLLSRRCDGHSSPGSRVLLSLTPTPEPDFAREATLLSRCCVLRLGPILKNDLGSQGGQA